MRRLIATATLLFLSIMLSAVAARALGSRRPVDPASFDAMLARDMQLGEESWCWQTICIAQAEFLEVPRLSTPRRSWMMNLDTGDRLTVAWRAADPQLNITIYGNRSKPAVTGIDLGRGYITVGELLLRYGEPNRVYRPPTTGKTKRLQLFFPNGVSAHLSYRTSSLALNSSVFVLRVTFRP
ncbi:MAG: hypothetical protein KF726_09540 [Anaerolineae bacterium]|nr:hypothetical protein [Anaerolineae bacterium]